MEGATHAPRTETVATVQPSGNGVNNPVEQATIPALFMAAQQKSISNEESLNWNDFMVSLGHILSDFTTNNNAAAEKIAKAADKIAEPTEVVIGTLPFERA